MRRVLVLASCAALTVLGGAQASAQVLPPLHAQHADSVGITDVVDVWAGLKALAG